MAHVWRLASKAAMREGVKGEAGGDDTSGSGGNAARQTGELKG